MTVTGRVTNGRLVVDEPTELPDDAAEKLDEHLRRGIRAPAPKRLAAVRTAR